MAAIPWFAAVGLYMDIVPDRARDLGRWAALHDPEGTARMEYVCTAWGTRRTDDDVILLGARALADLAELTTIDGDGTVNVEFVQVQPL